MLRLCVHLFQEGYPPALVHTSEDGSSQKRTTEKTDRFIYLVMDSCTESEAWAIKEEMMKYKKL